MSIQFTSTSTYLTRTTGLVQGSTASYSWCCWFRPDTDVTVSRQTIATLVGAGSYQGVYSNGVANDYRMEVNNGGGANVTTTQTLTAGHWYPIGYHRAGTFHQFYISTLFIATVNVNMAAVTFTGLFLGSDGAGTNAGTFAYFREWTASLSPAEFQLEACSRIAIKTTSLVTDTPLATTLLDLTSNHHDWTAVGAGFSFIADDPIPAGASASDPVVITLPYATTVDVKPTNVEFLFDHWLKYTSVAPEVYMGGWFFGQIAVNAQYRPQAVVFSDAGVTEYPPDSSISGGINLRFQMPVTAGNSYWFQAKDRNWTSMTSHTLTIDFLTAPNETIPTGSIFINDDTEDYYAAIISSTPGDSNHVLGFVPFAITSPEQGGDVSNDNGTILVQDSINHALNYYDQDLTLISATPITTSLAGVVRRVPDGSAFYYNVSNTVTRVSKAGVYGASHVLTGVTAMRAFAPNTNETILYAYITTAVNDPIKKWDLVNDVYLADLVAGVAGSNVRDLLVLTDGSIVAQRMAAGVMSVVQYSAAGAVLQTISIGAGSPGSLAYDYTDPLTHVLVRAQDLAYSGSSSMVRVNLTDGSKVQTDFMTFESGIYFAAVTATPIAKFGVSNSCPFFPIAFSTPAPAVEPTEYLIRRERWFPHIGQEQLRQFFSKFQIDLYAGNGISTGQGSDPLLEIDWSDDGGHTWSDIHFVQTGAIGAFRTRAILRRMGSSRDRVFRIACTDPVAWSIVNAYLDATLGSS